ncbi:hypothetical protein Talka_01024 [Tepidimonas alkaliphilus]|uniref:Uncharacterized protein n=1 Tax=Tepidimonas alkaliphilus TaxID=2588942 RepID=A0A554W978_9BURK|nr:hypothetical protein Talka_01024 [Tepidimonas alkaliphilus]
MPAPGGGDSAGNKLPRAGGVSTVFWMLKKARAIAVPASEPCRRRWHRRQLDLGPLGRAGDVR